MMKTVKHKSHYLDSIVTYLSGFGIDYVFLNSAFSVCPFTFHIICIFLNWVFLHGVPFQQWCPLNENRFS